MLQGQFCPTKAKCSNYVDIKAEKMSLTLSYCSVKYSIRTIVVMLLGAFLTARSKIFSHKTKGAL